MYVTFVVIYKLRLYTFVVIYKLRLYTLVPLYLLPYLYGNIQQCCQWYPAFWNFKFFFFVGIW